MARIGLSEGFRDLEEGPAQLLTIAQVSYDPKFNKAQVRFEDAEGGSCFETYRMGKGKTRGEQVAANVFSTMAKHALHDWSIEDIDPDDLVGRTVIADVTRDKSTNSDTGEERWYTHVRNFKEARAEAGADGAGDDDDLF